MLFNLFRRRPEPLRIACCANENYAIGLAVMLRSLLENLPAPGTAEIFIMDTGLEPLSRDAVLRSCADFDARIRFLAPDHARTAHLKVDRGMQTSVYLRLLLPEMVSGKRLLYLDCDMLVLEDISPLWDTDLAGHAVAAIQDVILSPTLASIPHHESIGLQPDAPYFSSALMLMDLERWRAERIGQRAIEHTEKHPEMIRWWDQDALNAVLAGDFLAVDPVWNVIAEASMVFGWVPGPDQAVLAERLIRDQKIAHFATRYKPWKHNCPHPKTDLFLETLDRTAYAGWRPDPATEEIHPPVPLGMDGRPMAQG